MKANGKVGEEVAAKFLQRKGCIILERNFRSKYGEIDILAKDEDYLIVVEVKNRSSNQMGTPAEAVNFRKQKKIQSTFTYYRMKRQISEYIPIRFDVVEVYHSKECHWIKNAFEACG